MLFVHRCNQRRSGWSQLLGEDDPVIDAYLFRRRFKLSQPLPEQWGWAATGEYNVRYAGRVIEELVELSPFTWLPMVPVVGLVEYIKLKKGVVGEDTEGLSVGAYAT